MMHHFYKFLKMIGVGTLVYTLVKEPLLIVHNWLITHYPQYGTTVWVVFTYNLIQWGLLLFCWIPAIRYLWVNTQRPGGAEY